jgi:hypothetical protein
MKIFASIKVTNMILDHTDPFAAEFAYKFSLLVLNTIVLHLGYPNLVEYYSNYPDQEPEYAARIHDRYFQVALTF